MTATQELQSFAQVLDSFSKENKLQFVCLQGEHDLLLGWRAAMRPYLYLTQVAEELACGHLIPTAEGRSFFILVRTPFAASDTLKFVTLRTYSLILLQTRDMSINQCERSLTAQPGRIDLWELLTQAAAAVLQAPVEGPLFVQPQQSAPFEAKTSGIVAVRATFCSGTLAGTVIPTANDGEEGEPASPVSLYLL